MKNQKKLKFTWETGVKKVSPEHQNKTRTQIGYQMYRTKQKIFDKNEMKEIHSKILGVFRGFGTKPVFTLEELREIEKIIDKK